ncbi:hypothetical protein [Nonomuraea sp. NPDC003754]
MRTVAWVLGVVGYLLSLAMLWFSYVVDLETYSAADPGTYNPVSLANVLAVTLFASLAMVLVSLQPFLARRKWVFLPSAIIWVLGIARIIYVWAVSSIS